VKAMRELTEQRTSPESAGNEISITRWLFRVCVSLLFVVLFAFVLLAQSGVQNIYDDLGRLVGVIDPSGNAAGYSYDAVGNLLSITRYTSAQASVLQFTPTSGPVGTVVTVYGTGFSTTISQDSVKFNGTAATITSAITNQFVTTVPSGATTGTISITTPAGSYTTTMQFTVTTSTGVPTITSFTPSSGTPGTALTITGTNFNTTPGNNQIKINLTHAFASSATSTQINTVVSPVKASGRISVGTPYGQTTSSQDFFIPFGSYTASQIGQSGRISFGGSQSVTLSSSNIALLLFDASAGQGASLQLSSSTYTGCTLYIFSPLGAQLTTAGCTNSVSFVNSTLLPISGTYTIGVQAGGSGTLTVGLTQDISQTITSATPITLSMVAGQKAQLTFTGSVGQTATVQASSNGIGWAPLSLVNPSGSTLATNTSNATSFFLTPQSLSTTGTYSIVVGPAPQAGSITIGLTIVPPSTSPPTRSSSSLVDYSNALSTHMVGLFLMDEGSGTTDVNLTDGQTASFSGSSSPTWNTSDPSIVFGGGGSLNSYLNAGTDLAFDQLTPNTMTVVAKVYVSTVAAAGVCEKNDGDVSAGFSFGWDSNGALRAQIGTNAVDMIVATTSNAISTGKWIQVAFTWDGTSGSALASNAHLFINGVEQPKATSVDGTGTIGYLNATNQPFRIGNGSLGGGSFQGSLNGKMAYLVVYKGRILTTTELGQIDAQLPIDTSDVSGTITPNGSAVPVTTTSGGQNAQLSFNGKVQAQATVQLSSNTIGSVTVSLLNPDGTSLTSLSSSSAAFSLSPVTLASSFYRIYVHPNGSTSGSITVTLVTHGGLGAIPSRPNGSAVDSSNSLSTSLVGLFLMNEGSGTTDKNIADAQTASFSGSSSPTWNTSDPSVVFGGGSSLNSYLNAGTDSAFDQLPTGQVTIVAKVYVSTVAVAGVAEKNDGDAIDSGFAFGWNSSGALKLAVETSGSDMVVTTASATISNGQWIQVAFTWNGTGGSKVASGAHLFLNGIEQAKASSQDGSGTVGYANATNKPFRIGNTSIEGIAGSLSGRMAYLAIYKGRILTTTELNQLDAQLPIH
jgi:YD repeat-containing protein